GDSLPYAAPGAAADQSSHLNRPRLQKMLRARFTTILQDGDNRIQSTLDRTGHWQSQEILQRGIRRQEIAKPNGGYVLYPFGVVVPEVKAVNIDQKVCRRSHPLKIFDVLSMHATEETFISFRNCNPLP